MSGALSSLNSLIGSIGKSLNGPFYVHAFFRNIFFNYLTMKKKNISVNSNTFYAALKKFPSIFGQSNRGYI